jgi:uncharacterized protein (TIGR02271 family)
MHREAIVNVTATGGLRGTIDTAEWPVDGSRREILVRLNDGRQVMVPADALTPTPDGGYRLTLAGTDLNALSAALDRASGSERAVIPVVEEELAVGKREVEAGRVRVTKLVHEEQRVVDQPLTSEEVIVERVPVNRVVEGPVEVRHEGETMIVPLLEEVLVVEKRLMLREEVRISRRRSETHRPQTVTVRKEDVKVERIPADSPDDGTAVARP